jgi:drug/metabolite transporter (DMT)-like permease
VSVHGEARGRLYILLAAVTWSTAGVLQRSLSVDTATQVAGRAFFALLALAAFIGVSNGRNVVAACRALGRAGVAFAVCLAVASGCFIVALNRTSVANVLFMQAAAPIAAALLGRIALHERVTPRGWACMGVALAGVAIMVGGPGGGSLDGFAISLVMTFGFAASIVIARSRRDVSMAPATCLAQLLVLAVALPFSSPGAVDAHDLVLLIALGVGQMGLGLVFLTLGARLVPAAEVALICLLEVVLGPLWVWLADGETPARATVIGGLVVVAAVAVQAIGRVDLALVRARRGEA